MINIVLAAIATFVAISIYSAYILLANIFLNTKVEADKTLWGIFGDTLGGTLNPILTFISFLAILYTIYLQSKELTATRLELARSASAQEKNIEKLQIQIDSQEKQKFENLFFKLIDLHENLSKNLLEISIDVNETIDEETGEFITTRVNYINHIYNTTIKSKFGKIKSARIKLHANNNYHGSYYILLYQILKNIFIHLNNIESDEVFEIKTLAEKIENLNLSSNEKAYSNIIRSLINKQLLALLAINCATDFDEENYFIYRLLLKRYCFFEHFECPLNIFQKPTNVEIGLLDYYDESYYGNNSYFKKLNLSKK